MSSRRANSVHSTTSDCLQKTVLSVSSPKANHVAATAQVFLFNSSGSFTWVRECKSAINKKESSVQVKIVLVTALSFLLYFSGNFLALFSRALETYFLSLILNSPDISSLQRFLLGYYFRIPDYQLEMQWNKSCVFDNCNTI